ncbi:insulinase family protein [Pusillimonas sp. TS35]|uniref:M16 family metallopeptidase n=1 Tax=Paracandidimonas lactea TaxID=2895524 RepID=UPI00136857F8|nr:pitrilysin family protein [Paracandidimonas lactea]MYN14473.1 insulinase family protein [Pusillimonas sp. TS35]
MFSFSAPTLVRAAALAIIVVLAAPVQAKTGTPPTAPAPSGQKANAALPAGVQQLHTVEGVTEYSLPNGLRVLLAPDASKPSTTVNMTYLVGARQENYGQTGMAHLLEHMLFRGTPTLRNALAEFSRRGLAANGSTSGDRTNYYASFASNPETLNWYLGWQADAMVNSLIAKEDLDAEMTVVRNEMERGENNPFQILLQKMQATAYQWHNYGHSTIGARSDVENVDVGQLRAFYKKYYQPDNAILIVTGRFDAAATLKTIATVFGKIPRPTRTLPPEYTVEPIQDGERLVALRRHGGTPLVAALYHIPAAGSPDYTALDLGVNIIADTPSGRLYHALVRENLAASVFGFASDMKQPGYALFGAELEPGMDQAKALATLTATLESVAEKPFTQEDLDRIRNKWLSNWNQLYANPAKLASVLSETSADGDWRLFFLQRDQVEDMKLETVQRVTQAYLVASNRTAGEYIPTDKPERAPASAPPDFQALFKGYTGKQTGPAKAAFEATPEHIDAATDRQPLVLPNGEVKLALLPKPTRGDRVEANLELHFGNADSLKGQREVAGAVAALLDQGTPSLTRQQIQDKFDALQAQVSFSGTGGIVSVNMSTVKAHLPELVSVVLNLLREADFPKQELIEYQRQASTAISTAMSEPSALASRALARHDNPWAPDDVRYTPTFEEERNQIAALTRQRLQSFHSTFYGAGNIEFSAVGAFEPDAIREALTKGLKGWQKAPAYTRLDNPYHAVPAERFHINTPDKANAFYLAKMPVKLQDTDPDFPALYLANYLLGSSETSRLWERIRVKEGLSYDVRSQLTASSFEPSGSWVIYAILAPQNSRQVTTAVNEELQRLLDQGFTDDEVKEGVRALLNYRKLARANDATLSAVWLNYLELGRTFQWSADIDKALLSLTAKQVNDTIRRWLQPNAFSVALAADASKQGEKAPPVPAEPGRAPEPAPGPAPAAAPTPGPTAPPAPTGTAQPSAAK